MKVLGYSFTIIKGTDAPAANSFIYTTMPVSFSVTDLAGTVHSFESSFSFRCSKNVAYATCSAFVYPSWDSSGTWKGWYAYYKPHFISSSRGFLLTTDGEPTVRLLTSLPDTDRYYIYSKTSEAVPVVYASRFTGFLQAQADRLVNAIATGGVAGSGTLAVDLAPIITRLDLLIAKSNDTVVNVINNNTYVTNVFQLDADTDMVDTTKDGVDKVSSLFKWLWNNTFKGAFDAADITKLDGLFYDPAAAAEEVPDGS